MVAHSQDTVFSLPGDLTLRGAETLQANLLDHLRNHAETMVELPDDYAADLSFVQLIEAARIFADQEEKALSLSRPADGALLDVLSRGGFVSGMTAQDRQFWLHQGVTQ